MTTVSRRQFIRLALGGLALSALSGCAPEEILRATATPSPQGTPLPDSLPVPTPSPAREILRNQNVIGFYVRYYKPFEAVDPARWTLSVEGLVRKPQKLTLPDVQSLPLVAQVSRMKCVECWSAAARWEGFRLPSLLQLVEPQPEAKWVHFYCADDYVESLTIEELLLERVLFVHRMDDAPLHDLYGAPLRLIVPHKYAYKSAKWVRWLCFTFDQEIGYWEARGYSNTADPWREERRA
jgi:DMSO/TMAO reductase YedYZ molybdopterin-dependent catalytic subunit